MPNIYKFQEKIQLRFFLSLKNATLCVVLVDAAFTIRRPKSIKKICMFPVSCQNNLGSVGRFFIFLLLLRKEENVHGVYP